MVFNSATTETMEHMGTFEPAGKSLTSFLPGRYLSTHDYSLNTFSQATRYAENPKAMYDV